jgi:hypothetical protein
MFRSVRARQRYGKASLALGLARPGDAVGVVEVVAELGKCSAGTDSVAAGGCRSRLLPARSRPSVTDVMMRMDLNR